MQGIGTNERTLVEILCTRDNASLMCVCVCFYLYNLRSTFPYATCVLMCGEQYGNSLSSVFWLYIITAHPHCSPGPSRTLTTTTTARSWRTTSGVTPQETSDASSSPCVLPAEMKPTVTQPLPTALPSSCTRLVSSLDPCPLASLVFILSLECCHVRKRHEFEP